VADLCGETEPAVSCSYFLNSRVKSVCCEYKDINSANNYVNVNIIPDEETSHFLFAFQKSIQSHCVKVH